MANECRPVAPPTDSFPSVLADVLAFRDARDWRQFHTPRHLAAAIAIEAAELQETMLWRSDEGVQTVLAEGRMREKIAEELADVLIFALLLAHDIGIEPSAAIRAKLAANAARYPVDKSRGNATKYTDL